MATTNRPEVGLWYENPDLKLLFQVVAYDENDGTIETQDYEGGVEALDLDYWNQYRIVKVQEPNHWRDAFSDAGFYDNGEAYGEDGEDYAASEDRYASPYDDFTLVNDDMSEGFDEVEDPYH